MTLSTTLFHFNMEGKFILLLKLAQLEQQLSLTLIWKKVYYTPKESRQINPYQMDLCAQSYWAHELPMGYKPIDIDIVYLKFKNVYKKVLNDLKKKKG